MKIYHLSHTDLDGYGAQYIAKFYLKNVVFFNANYGKEINEKFEKILDCIKNRADKDEKSLVLITDLNLTTGLCENFANALANENAKILLLDHHQSGLDCAKIYPWYLLDSSRCATKITYDFFSKIYGEDENLKKFVAVVNAVDIWLSDEKEFELGKVCLNMISAAKEINKIMFENESFEYNMFLLDQLSNYFSQNNAHIALDNDLHAIKKKFFKNEQDDTLSNLISAYVVDRLSANKEKFKIQYEDKTGILTYAIGNTSVIGNDFLLKNPDIDFFIDVTPRKTLSFRANGNVDVAAMAKNLVGGGGHVNASGGMFAAFKDANSYENIKEQIVALIAKKINIGEKSE